MSDFYSITSQIQSLIDSANATTGGTDDNLTDGVHNLISGYGTKEVLLEDITITENGSYSASSGYDGLGNVTVNVASNAGSGVSMSINGGIAKMQEPIVSMTFTIPSITMTGQVTIQ